MRKKGDPEAQKLARKLYFKKYYERNRKKLIKAALEYRKNNLKKCQARCRQYAREGRNTKWTRLWQKRNKEKCNISAANWRNKNKYKYKAQRAVRHAVRTGKIKRTPCEVCGEIKVQGHHDDYSKPLEVRWLCHKHHMHQHRIYD